MAAAGVMSIGSGVDFDIIVGTPTKGMGGIDASVVHPEFRAVLPLPE
jgi:hypothetical protein